MPDVTRDLVDAVKALKQKTQITLKRIYGWFLLHGQTSGGADKPLLTEDGGQLASSLYATNDSSAVTAVLSATDGSVYVFHKAEDRAGATVRLKATTDGALHTNSIPQIVGSILIPSTEGILYDPTGTYAAADILEIEFMVVNVDGTNAVDVNIGRDVAAGGGLSDVEYWVFSETVPAKASLVNPMPMWINGNDKIRGIAGAANDAVFHYKVRLVN